jgi:hypothetical protein
LSRVAENPLANRAINANPAQHENAIAFSDKRGEKTKTKPWSLTSEEKLDTQKGIRKSLNVCQNPGLEIPDGDEMLSIRAIPITPLIPNEVIQIRGLGSK